MAEAARNVSCVGAAPIAITNCLNFGNPEKGPVSSQFARVIDGMVEACEAFGIPVISGNVSFYNESFGQAIYPTPVVGMLGLLDDVSVRCGSGFGAAEDVVLLLGDASPALDGSEYQKRWFGRVEGRIPDVDLEAEVVLQGVLRRAIEESMLRSAHDCSDGGLAVALAECCLFGEVGARVTLDDIPGCVGGRPDITLFGEAPTLVIVSAAPGASRSLQALCQDAGVPCTVLGTVGGDRLQATVASEGIDLPLSALHAAFDGGLSKALAE